MKIVLIVYLFPPKWLAGTEIASYNIAKYLAKKGHEVHVITQLDDGLPEKEIRDNFCIHRINLKKIRIIGIIFYQLQILLNIKKINPDIVHIQTISNALPGFFSKVFFKVPYVIWAQGSDVYLPDKFTKLISKPVLRNASTIITLNKDMKIKVRNISKRNDINILPNGIELEKFKFVCSKKQNNTTKKTILFVGSLLPIKGVGYLINAMNIVQRSLPNANLLIVGSGSDRDKLKILVQKLNLQECIHFTGKVSNEKIPGYMAKADLFVLPSLSEGFPLVIAEAMASGLPIVTTNVGGLPEIVKDGENGFIVEPKNPEALAEKIILLLNNRDLCENISNINKENAKNYSWNEITDKLEKTYQEAYLKRVRFV